MLLDLCPNLVDLYELVPSRDTSGGNVPVPTLVAQDIPCSVQPGGGNARSYFGGTQERIVITHTVLFDGEALGIEVNGVTPLKKYRLTWTDAQINGGGGMFLNVIGYVDATIGYGIAWRADCTQVK